MLINIDRCETTIRDTGIFYTRSLLRQEQEDHHPPMLLRCYFVAESLSGRPISWIPHSTPVMLMAIYHYPSNGIPRISNPNV